MEPKVTLTVTCAVVLLTSGTDLVSLYTDKPSPFPPAVSKQPLALKFEVSSGKGIKYCKDVFGIDAEVIDTRCNQKSNQKGTEDENKCRRNCGTVSSERSVP